MFVVFETIVFSVYHVFFSAKVAAKPSYTSFQIPVRLQIKHNLLKCHNVKLLVIISAAKDCLVHWISSRRSSQHQLDIHSARRRKGGSGVLPPSTS